MYKSILSKAKADGIILTNQEKRKHQAITEIKYWLAQYDWDLFVTLTFKYSMYDEIKVNSAIEKFLNKLSAEAFGRRSNKRVVALPVIEKCSMDNSLHVHMMIQNPTPYILNEEKRNSFRIRDAVIQCWLQSSSSAGNPALASSSDEWIKKVLDVSECVRYMTKQMKHNLEHTIPWDQCSLTGRKPETTSGNFPNQ